MQLCFIFFFDPHEYIYVCVRSHANSFMFKFSCNFQRNQRVEMRWWWKTIAVVVLAVALVMETVTSNPQTNLVTQQCSQFNTWNTFEFFSNLNATLDDLRRQLSVDKTHFATAQQARTSNPVYSMVQCRKYLATADCVACFDVAAVDIRKFCNLANGARVIYDGCFLR